LTCYRSQGGAGCPKLAPARLDLFTPRRQNHLDFWWICALEFIATNKAHISGDPKGSYKDSMENMGDGSIGNQRLTKT